VGREFLLGHRFRVALPTCVPSLSGPSLRGPSWARVSQQDWSGVLGSLLGACLGFALLARLIPDSWTLLRWPCWWWCSWCSAVWGDLTESFLNAASPPRTPGPLLPALAHLDRVDSLLFRDSARLLHAARGVLATSMTYAALSGLGRAYGPTCNDKETGSASSGILRGHPVLHPARRRVGAVALFGLRRGLRAMGRRSPARCWRRRALPRRTLDRPADPDDARPCARGATSFLTRVQHDVAEQGGLATVPRPTHAHPLQSNYAAKWALSDRTCARYWRWTVLARTRGSGSSRRSRGCGATLASLVRRDRPGPPCFAYPRVGC